MVDNQSTTTQALKDTKNQSRFLVIMGGIWNWLTNPHSSIKEIGARRQAQFLAAMTLALAPTTGAGLIATTFADKAFTSAFYGLAGITTMIVIAYILSRSRYFRSGSYLAVASLCVSAYIIIWGKTDTPAITLFSTLPLAFTLSYALLSLWGMVALVIGNVIAIALIPLYAPYAYTNDLFTAAGMLISLGVLSVVVIAFRKSVEKQRLEEMASVNRELQNLQGDLERRVAARTRELELSAEVGSHLSQLRNLDDLLIEAVEITKKRFDLYYCQVYLVDLNGNNLVLRAGTGSVGTELIRRGHRLPIGPGSINGSAAGEKQPVIVADTMINPNFRANPLLPLTRSEIAIPLLVSERVVGLLDMQSIHPNAFSTENLPAFQSLAVQLAIAITNAELFAQAERNRSDLELQSRRMVQTGWHDFLNAIDRGEYLGYTFEQNQITQTNQPIQPSQNKQTITIPLMLVGIPLGVIQLERSEDYPWTPDDIQIVSTIANQASRQIDIMRILAQSDAYRMEAVEATRRLTREGWQEYIQSMLKPEADFVYDLFQVTAGDGQVPAPQARVTNTLKLRDETIGELAIEGVDRLTDEDQVLVNTVVERLSLQLENLRLLESTERGRQQIQQILGQTEILYEIGRQLNTARDEAEILTSLARPAIEQNASVAALMYLDLDSTGQPEWMEVVSTWQRSDQAPAPVVDRQNVGNSPFVRLWITQPTTPVLVSNVREDPRIDEIMRPALVGANIYALAFVPLTLAGRWLGVVSIHWDRPHLFDTQETAIYQSLINLVAPVVESRRLYKQAQRRSDELAILNEMGRSLTSLLDVNVIVQLIYKYASQLMDTTNFFVALYDHQVDRVSFPLVYNDNNPAEVASHPLGNGITDYIIRNGQSLLMSDKVLEHMQAVGIDFVPLGDDTPALSWLGVPIIYGTQVLGVIAVQSVTTPGQYKELDRDLLTAIASQAAIAIENARIFSQTQRQADFEAIINNISQRIQNTTSVENALQVAARELGRALGASRAAVQLGIIRGRKI